MASSLPGVAEAHPHAHIDQQVQLSLGSREAIIVYRVTPSFKDGAHMFGHLDLDHDGSLSARERDQYARALVSKTALLIDGKRTALRIAQVEFPDKAAFVAGTGTIAVLARARVGLAPPRQHVVGMAIGYSNFGPNWFIQPYYFANLRAGRNPDLVRKAHSNAIGIQLYPAG